MSRNKLIAKNTLFMATRTLVSLFVSFYTTRVILHTLGISDYGLFNVIYGVVAFFVFIVASFNDSVQRFMSISLGNKEITQVKNIVKNSFLIYFICGLIFLVVLLIFKNIVIFHVLDLPSGSFETAKIIYVVSALAIFITIIQTPLNALVLSHEKMSFYAYMAIFDALSKLLVTYFLVLLTGNKVIIYSCLLFLSSCFVFCVYFIYCYRNFKYSFTGGEFSKKTVKEISIFSFWNVFGNFAFVCRTQGVNVLINIFFGVAVNAAYAISVSVINATNSFVQSFITAIRPQIFKSYGEKDTERFYLLVSMGSKYTFCFLFLLCCPILVSAPYVLEFWLVHVPDYSIMFVRAFLVVALIDSFSNCLISGIQSTGKIKIYQIIVGFAVFLNLPLAYFLFWLGASPVSLFYSLLVVSLVCLPLRLFFLTKQTGFDSVKYFNVVIIPCIIASALSISINYYVSNLFHLHNIYYLGLFFITSGFISLGLIFLIVASKREKDIVLKAMLRKFK